MNGFVAWSDRKDCQISFHFISFQKYNKPSPHFLWSHTWTNVSLDFFCAVSSGQPVICPRSLASICVLTGIFWMWPRGSVIPQCPWNVLAQVSAIWEVWRGEKQAILTFMYLISISVFLSSSAMSSLWNLMNCNNKVNGNKLSSHSDNNIW